MSSKAKPRTKPPKSKGGRSAGRSPAKSKTTKAAAKAKVGKPRASGARKRLRPGELDGLVIAHLRKRADVLPLGPGAIAKGIGRSSGAVGNCLERLARAEGSPVRRVTEKPRTYDLAAGVEGIAA